jgi:hypothetical protein
MDHLRLTKVADRLRTHGEMHLRWRAQEIAHRNRDGVVAVDDLFGRNHVRARQHGRHAPG